MIHRQLQGLSGQRLAAAIPSMGMVAQSLAAAKRQKAERFLTAGSGTFTAKVTGWHTVLVYGGGGNGGSTPGTAASCGGGGGASMKRVWLRRGEVVAFVVGPPAGVSTASLAGRFSMGATAGSTGGAGYTSGGPPGVGFGGDVNRTGGYGQGWTDPDSNVNTNDGVETPCTDGEWGGRSGNLSGNTHSGGGGAGFRDILPDLYGDGGDGASAGPGGTPGGGGVGLTVGSPGGGGAVVFIYEG